MIAKVCKRRRDGRSCFAAAIAYVAAPGKASHLALHEILSLDLAAAQMRFISDACPRCRDPLYHLVVSWPEDETPTDDEVEEAARHLLRRIGFDDHQWVLAVHRNTASVHVHILICRVHPITGRAHYPHRDWVTLDRACREVELAQEWSHDRGRHVVVMTGDHLAIEDRPRAADTPPRLSDPALRYERATGRMSFQSWVATQPADIVRDAADWAEVHGAFHELGIAIRRKGSGHVIVDLADPTTVAKLSHMGLGGLRKIKARLGETYAPPDPTPPHHLPDDSRLAACVFRRIRPGVSVESAHRFGESAHPNCKLVGAGAEPWIYVMKVVGLVAKHRP
ncbi:relaxase/mobilization nuclease MobA (plasmid) [Azospirillum sp. B510]|uniref:relaxase/mobilization nuclease domain-containing protein n=1 Tax=Azospirillum sp. (strain B510) TaxID=137722 RepID=UPI0001C4CD77|nr:relaxase/mobilization nuclease domain-containing protein [Azospirillum sp. B510]BAI76379.1 relaxase/mobilization nuclease MobA [Azospirillum sp. B510]